MIKYNLIEMPNNDLCDLIEKNSFDEWCLWSEVKKLEEALEAIASCISNPRTGYQEDLNYAYKTAMEALGREV